MNEQVRFLKKVSVIDNPSIGSPCWIWTGCKDNKGYGRFSVNGENRLAHHYAYETFNRVEAKQYVTNTCGNQLCVNPQHLCEKKNVGRKPRVSPDAIKELKTRGYSTAQIAGELNCSQSLVRKILARSL